MSEQMVGGRRPKTLADLYEDRDLSPAQVRRLVTLLGLSVPRGARSRSDEEQAAGAA